MSLPRTFVSAFHDAAAVARMPYNKFGSVGDIALSKVSIGGSAAGAVFGGVDDERSIGVLVAAVRAGVNMIDTAPWYGNGKSEKVIGQALKRIPREAVYVHTKVGRYAPDVRAQFDFSAPRVTASVDESLQRLGIDAIDLIQVHDPEFAHAPEVVIEETLPALGELQKAGKVKRIGVTGYDLGLQRELVMAAAAKGIHVHSCLTYCHYALNDVTLQTSGFLAWAAQQGVGIINASPLSMGLLTPGGPPAWHPSLPQQKAAAAKAAKIAAERGFDICLVAQRFASSCPGVSSTLFSTDKPAELTAALAAATEPAPPEEVQFREELMSSVFSPEAQGQIGWAGVEVAKYWTRLGKAAAADGVFRGKLRIKEGIYTTE